MGRAVEQPPDVASMIRRAEQSRSARVVVEPNIEELKWNVRLSALLESG